MRGDLDRAASLLVRAHGAALWARARRLVPDSSAEDLFQDTLIAAVTALRAGRFKGDCSLRAYVMAIARHKAFRLRGSFWFKLFHRRSIDPVALADLPEPAPDDERAANPDAEELLATLDGRERIVVKMRLEGMRFAQVGRCLGISEDNAAQIYSRAVKKVRARIAR